MEDDKIARECCQRLKDLAAAIDDALDGKAPFCTACRAHGISSVKARRMLGTPTFQKLRAGNAKLETAVSAYYCRILGTGCEQLYADIFGLPMSEIGDFGLPPDVEETVDYVLKNLATSERNKDIIARYYGLGGHDEESYSEIRKAHGIARETVRMRINHVLQLLRYPTRLEILEVGLAEYKSIDEAKTKAFNEKVESIKAKIIKDAVAVQQEQVDSIEALQLSARSCNCLKRTGIKTVSALIGLSDEELCSVQGLGKKRVDEIKSKLAKYLGQTTDKQIGQFDVAGNDAIEDSPIEMLNLSARSYNCLKRTGIKTVGALMTLDENALYHIRNLGKRSVDEIKSKLAMFREKSIDRQTLPLEGET